MACFSEPGTVLLSWCDDENDPQFEVSMKNLEILENTSDAKGRRLQVSSSHAAPCSLSTLFYTLLILVFDQR
jgi:agmatine deiminase